MSDITTIRLHEETKKKLEKRKVHPREPYEDVLKRLLSESREKNPREQALEDYIEKIKVRSEKKIQKIYLYGSYARGEETEESDIDILIIWKEKLSKGREIASEIATDILVKHDVLISPKVISSQKFEEMKEEGNQFILNILKEGTEIG